MADGREHVAWCVGWAESGTERKTRAFACVVRGDGVRGRDVRAMVERILEAGELL
jgi:beta-lactamase class D